MDIYDLKIEELYGKRVRLKRIRIRIKKTGLSRRSFCRKYGLDPTRLCQWLKGHEIPTTASLILVERALESEGV